MGRVLGHDRTEDVGHQPRIHGRHPPQRQVDPVPRAVGQQGQEEVLLEKRPRLDVQIKDWEVKLKRLRQDSFETYDAGLKAGFLPGELDGKGIWP